MSFAGIGRVAAVRRALQRARDAGQHDEVARLYVELTDLRPDDAAAWFDRGLHAKRQRQWALSLTCNERALALVGDAPEEAAAWNLGIAATAVGDWATARRAWVSYGIPLPPGDGPVEEDFGMVPVRLNPEVRHPGEAPLVLDGQEHATEVVWIERLSPAHGIVRNVPTPVSGHRFGDVVLHDGEPVGERLSGGRPVPVFNELARLERSTAPTHQVEVQVADDADVAALVEAASDAGFAATEWERSVRMLCRACSEGAPVDDAGHEHPALRAPGGPRVVAVAAPREEAVLLLGRWAQRHGCGHGPLQEVG